MATNQQKIAKEANVFWRVAVPSGILLIGVQNALQRKI
jgi:hypothetical protein